eukprot:jgi/Chrpa1/10131/Chrysochromulina_OHIO_Genome00019895-RA
MKGFSKITFDAESGAATAVVCAVCGRTACFCKPGVAAKPKASPALKPTASPALSALSHPSPALSALSVSVKSAKSPTFTFEPISGYGTTEPPPFSLGGPPEEDHFQPHIDSFFRDRAQQAGFLDGGSPTWLFHEIVFALSIDSVPRDEMRRLIERHGGSVSQSVHRKVDLLVASEKAVQRETVHVRRARKRGIPIVMPSFVQDCIAHGDWLAMEDYAPPRGLARTAAAGAASAPPFKWRRVIRQVLREAPGGSLRLKRLRKAVLAHLGAHLGEAGAELSADGGAAARRLFRRKLKKATGVMVLLEQDGTVVRLARNG